MAQNTIVKACAVTIAWLAIYLVKSHFKAAVLEFFTVVDAEAGKAFGLRYFT